MHQAFARSAQRVGFDWNDNPTMEQLEEAVGILEADWADAMKRRDEFIRERRIAKSHGRRQLSDRDRERTEAWGWRTC
jgi:hypothetical protein